MAWIREGRKVPAFYRLPTIEAGDLLDSVKNDRTAAIQDRDSPIIRYQKTFLQLFYGTYLC